MTTASQQLYRCTPRQAVDYIDQILKAGLVPNLLSSPGIGKSSLAAAAAKRHNLKLIDHRLSTSAPEDLSGLPRFDADGKAYFAPFADLFPLEDTPMPEGKDGWLLFLDEANSATKMVQAASYKLVLDKKTGQFPLHPHTAMMMAGNLSTDKAIVTQLSTAMQSRVITLELMINHKEWIEDFAIPENLDDRVLAYIAFQGDGALMDFDPNHQEHTFCCPRTWEFMSKLVHGQQFTLDADGNFSMNKNATLYSGTISSMHAVAFIQFCRNYHTIPKLAEVVASPSTTRLPEDPGSKWAAVTHLAREADEHTFGSICTYINRLDMTFQILFYRLIKQRQPKLRQHPAMISSMVKLSKYIND